jgi:hypothetical protein
MTSSCLGFRPQFGRIMHPVNVDGGSGVSKREWALDHRPDLLGPLRLYYFHLSASPVRVVFDSY